jgi:PAS domain S-box-containing protein
VPQEPALFQLERDEKADKTSSTFLVWKSRGLPEGFLMPAKPTYEELEQRIRDLERLQSEHNQAETKLRLAQFSVDQSSEGILWISEDARIRYANHAARRHLGYSGDELTGMSVFDIDPDFTAEIWPGHWRKLKQKGQLLIESRHASGPGMETEVGTGGVTGRWPFSFSQRFFLLNSWTQGMKR